jgi:hypothetical protein
MVATARTSAVNDCRPTVSSWMPSAWIVSTATFTGTRL